MTRRSTGNLAEFGPVLFILFIVVLLPLIAFFSFVDGVATVYFAANSAAKAAGPATTLKNAKVNVSTVGKQIIAGPLGAFASISPADDSKLALTVLQIGVKTGTSSTFTSGTIDTDNNTYEYQVTASYGVKPLFFPGDPIPLQFTSSANVEHPEGLNTP
jgi:hypothetical protein